MPYTGQCNCGSIQVTIPEKPTNTVACHCRCCRKAGGAFSINIPLPLAQISVSDTRSTLAVYGDTNTTSGNTMARNFCSACGSPIYSVTPLAPEMAFLKATLFEEVAPLAPEGGELFRERGVEWLGDLTAAGAKGDDGEGQRGR